MELTFALDSAVKGLRDKGSPVLRRDMLMTASLQSSHFKCPLKKEKKNKQTNNISYSDVAYVAEDVLTYNLGQNGWEIYPPSPLPTKSRIGNGALWLLCGFILDLGGGLGFAVPFYYVQDCNLLKKIFCPRLKVLRAKLIISTGAHVLTPPYGKYLTHAHNQITLAVAAMDSCFSLIGATLSDLMRVLLLVFFLQIHFRPKFCNFRSLSNESPTIFSYFLKFKFHISLPKLGYFS